jgi:hypothetical protein
MKLKLTVIAAALALGFAGAAQAQSTPSSGMGKGPDRADRKVHNADEERIESEYKAAKEKCDTMQGNQKDICQAEAKAQEKVAKAENDAKNAKDQSRAMAKVERVKADTAYDVAKQRCQEKKGNEKDVCMKDAKAERDRARATTAKHERSAGTGSSKPEKR